MKRISLLFILVCFASTTVQAKGVTPEQLVEKALTSNPEIAAYEAEIKAARALHSVSGAMQNPEITFGTGRNKVSSGSNDSSGLAYTAGISQPIDWPGRRGLREAIAKQEIALAELGLERFKFNLAAQVRVLAQKIAAYQNISKTSSQVSKRYTALRKTLSQRSSAGVAAKLELDAIKVAAEVAQLKAADADIATRSAILELNRITGLEITEETVVAAADFKLKKLPSDAELFGKAAENNYDIRMKRFELEQQGFKVRLAENERYPTFAVGPFISQENASEDQTIVGLNVSVPFPVWDTGAAKVNSAKARQVQAEISLNLQQREVEKKLAEAAMVFRTHQVRLKATSANSLSRSASEAEKHYQLGGIAASTYITVQDKYLEMEEAINSAKIKALEAGLIIEEMTGDLGSVIQSGKKI